MYKNNCISPIESGLDWLIIGGSTSTTIQQKSNFCMGGILKFYPISMKFCVEVDY